MRYLSTALLAAVVVTGPVLNGCSAGQGLENASGVPTALPAAQRQKPGQVDGETLEGAKVSLHDHLGEVVVINVWGSWCSTCRAEADDLAAAAAALTKQGVLFLGINTRDTSRDNALAFQNGHHVTYPSIFDPGGQNLLAFRGTLPPAAIPSTVVIDAEGRVAARILGAIPSTRTLVDLVDEVSASR